jgi:hypothetical protein
MEHMVSLEFIGFAGLLRLVNSVLSDLGATSIKVTFWTHGNRL